MANIKSQKKRIKTNEKRRLRNKAVRSEVKTFTKKFEQTLEAGDREASLKALQEASRKLDIAVSKGVLHKNSAANHKSSMARQLSSSSPN